jgi:signal transduction histidine kinase
MRAIPTAKFPLKQQELTVRHVRLGIAVLVLAFGVVASIAYLVFAINFFNTPFLGVTVNHTMTVNASISNGNAPWPGREAGLQIGDQIIAIDDVAVSNSSAINTDGTPYTNILDDYNVGDVVDITFVYDTILYTEPRNEAVRCDDVDARGFATCTVAVPLSSMPDVDFITFFIVPFIAGVLVLGLTAGMLYIRPLDDSTFVIALVLVPLALAMTGIFDVGSSHRLPQIWFASGVLLGMMIITTGLIFPQPIPIIYRRPLLRFIPGVFGVLLVIYTLVEYRSGAPIPLPISNQLAVITAIIGIAILAALAGFYHRRNAATRIQRDQANIITMGMLLGLAPAVFWIAGRLFPSSSVFLLSVEATMPFLITPAISLVYAALRYNVFDTDRMLSQGVTYGILLVALGTGYLLLVLGATLLATETIQADNPLLIVLTIFFVSLLFVPVRTALQRRVDEVYFRVRRDYQSRLEDFSQQLTSLAGPDIMIKTFRNLLNDTITPTNTLIFLRNPQSGDYVAYGDPEPETDITFSEDSGVIELLKNSDTAIYLQPGRPYPPELHIDKARLGIIRVMIIAGMPGDAVLNGFVAIGPPRSGAEGYRFEQLRFVRNLVGQLSIAVERATVIQSLERSVTELEVLSQVSQAVNFTVDTQDLLELISTQALRLIQAPYFYIVLYDTTLDRLYYAFFQEYGERRPEVEDVKWATGDDLYSEVIQTGQPIRVSNYARTMAQRGYRIQHEDEETQAWLAVPMSAGGRTLGVMATGETDPDVLYSEEQMRVFGDIGALAASAIDKSRLFTEANARARQLAVLNDISRQLVATEGDVERLLDLVTTSAVDILNAEAGSLLLTVEDGSGDLEFRVAVGGTGDDLVGKRLKKGYGLVGRVAETGRPVISNDTTQDSDWEGEVVEEGFNTQSILAVPLIAKDRVIGVLEVINKLDGSVYVEEDVELLTTFAGQAAVAFENARLFQQTDLQLSQRVRELEALERIDRELNQNLDLFSVAEITVRWAVRNSNATAGLLGVPDDEAQYLHVVARQGYDVDDVPEGAEGDRWPMGRGIVKRVVRSRRADLQPYVSMDPDYVPSLRGALSQITVPMMAGNEISAILILETDEEPRLNLLDQDWVQRLAEHASIAIENAKLYDELTRANETKSEFMGFAAHELKNPLTSVMGFASTLGSSMATAMTTEQIQNFATIIQSNANRMESIISDLRDIAASDANKLAIAQEAVELLPLVNDTLMSLQGQIDEKAQIVNNEITSELPLIYADPKRLIQVLVNFISNANKYSPPEAIITISAQVYDNYRSRKGERLGPAMQITVSDNGIGMDEEDLSKIFKEDYFRSENELAREQKGTGLGMMITKRLIEGHGGEVWVESEIGVGSSFHFIMPLAPEETEETAEAEGATD